MLDNLKGKNILLASNSPRRKELLNEMGVEFRVVTKNGISEDYPADTSAKDVAEFIANKKADAYSADLKDGDVLITADTVVIFDKKILGKPHSEEEAVQMLMRLCGHTHKVITGVTISTTKGRISFSVKTKVTMRTLSEDVIRRYVADYKPLDKAGAYGIQEWIGTIGIDYIEGSYQNVMGLPTQRLYAELSDLQ